jgi:hypothetical protein
MKISIIEAGLPSFYSALATHSSIGLTINQGKERSAFPT